MLTYTHRQFGIIAGFAFLSWLGMMIHNAIELPQLTILNPQIGLPTLVYIILVLGWWRAAPKRVWAIALLSWALLHLLVGGIITVIPFSFLPFYPEQRLRHYLSHVIYSVAQLPLIIKTFQSLRPAQR